MNTLQKWVSPHVCSLMHTTIKVSLSFYEGLQLSMITGMAVAEWEKWKGSRLSETILNGKLNFLNSN